MNQYDQHTPGPSDSAPAPQTVARDTEPLSAEQELSRGIIHTDVDPAAAKFICLVFAILILAVPVTQIAYELNCGRRPQVLDLLAHAPKKANFKRYEDDLAKASILKQAVQPTVQSMLCRLGFGNSKVAIGTNGWVFYMPGLNFVGGPGILDENRLHPPRGKLTEIDMRGERQRDPRPAILQFNRQCQALGVHLILLPIPDKVMLQPAQLSSRFSGAHEPVVNPDFATLLSALRSEGVDVFDEVPSELGADYFLIGDTHWTPEWMETVAARLAQYIRDSKIASGGHAEWRTEPFKVSNAGDLVQMLKLPSQQAMFYRQSVTINRILDKSGLPWQPSRDAEILMLGDSFCNIYSLESMGWGDGAGFAEHLSAQLHKPIDRIARNDAGAYATRELLSRELAKGRNRLAGKKVVIWEFTMRELTEGDWRPLEMVLAAEVHHNFLIPPAQSTLTVTGTIATIATSPRPGSVPYKDHIVALHLVDIKEPADTQAFVYVWSMHDNVSTSAAHYREGDLVTLKLSPWSEHENELGSINRADLPDSKLLLEEPCWGEEIRK